MTKAVTNEGRCCDAVLRILEAAHGTQRHMRSRDSPESRGIEASCDIGDQHYALEHTLIEPFPDNQRDDVAFGRVFDTAFEADIASTLKPNLAYTITVNVYAFREYRGKQLEAVRANLLAWVRTRVIQLRAPQPGQSPRETRIQATPPETPVSVTLACRHSKVLGGRLMSERFAPEDLESLRSTRLLKALEDKGPKLHAARVGNTRTVLVAENHDFALTNESLLSGAFDDLCTRVPHAPDDIYVVDTRSSSAFNVTQVRCARQACLLMGDTHSDWEYKTTDLDEL